MPVAVAFAYIKKSFDSVEISKLIEAIVKQAVDPVYVRVLQHIYQDCSSFISLHKDYDSFQLEKGVRQGDTSSPKLFRACLELIFRNLNWENNGIRIDGEYLRNLRFADDILLFAANLQDLHRIERRQQESSPSREIQ